MRITIDLDDVLLLEAKRVTGVQEHAALISKGLEALIEREGARRLARKGATQRALRAIPRRRST